MGISGAEGERFALAIPSARTRPLCIWGFTVSASHLEGARSYVLNQETHHRTKTFQEEYVEMLTLGLVEYDEKYLW